MAKCPMGGPMKGNGKPMGGKMIPQKKGGKK